MKPTQPSSDIQSDSDSGEQSMRQRLAELGSANEQEMKVAVALLHTGQVESLVDAMRATRSIKTAQILSK